VHTLLDALNDMATIPERKVNAAMRLPISGCYKIKGVGDVLAGRVEQGEVKPNDEVIFLPTHTLANPCTGKVRRAARGQGLGGEVSSLRPCGGCSYFCATQSRPSCS
jgi:translation elongation factor EF-1alpha